MRNVRRLTVFTDRGGLLRIDPRTQERRLPAVHVVLRVAGQLQGAIILVHIPAGTDAGGTLRSHEFTRVADNS